MKTFLSSASVLFLLLATACGGGGGGDEAAAAAGEGGGASSVSISDQKYNPADVTVSAGSDVTWTNEDEAPHTVTFSDKAVKSSEQLAKGDDFSTTFDAAGSYDYVCAVHPEMKGKVTVQ